MLDKTQNNSPAAETTSNALAPTHVPAQSNPSRRTALIDRFVDRPAAADFKPSIIGQGVVVRGEIELAGAIHIEGRLIGSVLGTTVASTVHIGTTGLIEGKLVCNAATIKGRFSGELTCDEIEIASSAHVKARVTYRRLSVQPGAVLDGELVVAAIPSVL